MDVGEVSDGRGVYVGEVCDGRGGDARRAKGRCVKEVREVRAGSA